MGLCHGLIAGGFAVMGATKLHRLAAPLTRGIGAILMLHRVRPPTGDAFAPNGLLEITPDYLEAALGWLTEQGYDLVDLDEALLRTADGSGGRPFAALTFDDGTRDHLDVVLPILERHRAPATFFIVPGFADRTARLWWLELEAVVRRAERIAIEIDGMPLDLRARSATEKQTAYETLYWLLRRRPEDRLLATIALLCGRHGVDGRALVEEACLDWAGVAALARHPLATIGAHTLSHPMLAKHPENVALAEMAASKAALEQRLGRPVRHFAYPVGDRTSAGAREFRLAAELGFASAVTTRPGLLFPGHAEHPMALPRVSLNGNHQDLGSLDILLSGLAFALWNGGRRVDAA